MSVCAAVCLWEANDAKLSLDKYKRLTASKKTTITKEQKTELLSLVDRYWKYLLQKSLLQIISQVILSYLTFKGEKCEEICSKSSINDIKMFMLLKNSSSKWMILTVLLHLLRISFIHVLKEADFSLNALCSPGVKTRYLHWSLYYSTVVTRLNTTQPLTSVFFCLSVFCLDLYESTFLGTRPVQCSASRYLKNDAAF